MDLRDPNAHRFFTIVIALGTAGWIVNAVVDSSALTWAVAAIWLLLIVEAVAQTWRVVPGAASAVASSGGLRLGWVASVVAGPGCGRVSPPRACFRPLRWLSGGGEPW